MSEAKHTPGPWTYRPIETGGPEIEVVFENGEDIGEYAWNVATVYPFCGNGLGNAEPNARLIAAAPDMLQALRVVEQHHATSPHIGLIRAAIAKAEGRS